MRDLREEFRRIGLDEGLLGTKWLEEVICNQKSVKKLTNREVEEILYAWESRNYVPISLVKNVDRVKPSITKEEVEAGIYHQEDYNRNYIEMIVKYFGTLM